MKTGFGSSITADVHASAKRELLLREFLLPYAASIAWIWVVMWDFKITAAGVTIGLLIGLASYKRNWPEKLWDRSAIVAIERRLNPPITAADFAGYKKRYQWEICLTLITAVASMLISVFAISGVWGGIAVAIPAIFGVVTISERFAQMKIIRNYVMSIYGNSGSH